MTKTDVFFDTNVLVYALVGEPLLAERSLSLLADGGVVSVQVLNECASAMMLKFSATWADVVTDSEQIRELCTVVAVTEETHVRGLEIAKRHKLNVNDGMIVAAAALAGCTTLYSEDMHDGLVIDGVTIRNPYTP